MWAQEFGEINTQLAEVAELDRQKEADGDDHSNLFNDIFGLFVGAAHVLEREVRQDVLPFTLVRDTRAIASW